MDIFRIEQLLKSNGIPLHRGLTSEELQQIEQIYSLRFPPDLRKYLSHMLPAGNGFPRWRDLSNRGIDSMREYLNRPLAGILFDVRHNNFWYSAWGERPEDEAAAEQIATQQYAKAPRLVPIYGHRYLPIEPCESGNPVLSVYQTDVIAYGADLEDYFRVEYKDKQYADIDFPAIKSIDFWLDLESGMR